MASAPCGPAGPRESRPVAAWERVERRQYRIWLLETDLAATRAGYTGNSGSSGPRLGALQRLNMDVPLGPGPSVAEQPEVDQGSAATPPADNSFASLT